MHRKWIRILAAFLLFTCAILLHEFGHFLAAQLCDVHVEKFQIGFGSELFSIGTLFGTTFSVGPIPFGGFVSFDDHFSETTPALTQIFINISGMLLAVTVAFVATLPSKRWQIGYACSHGGRT